MIQHLYKVKKTNQNLNIFITASFKMTNLTPWAPQTAWLWIL